MGYLGLQQPLHSLGTDVPTLVALLVCLIPTTIGALLAAIGIAGMDRALQANIIAKSGKAVETAGDIDVVLLDKTGTITEGNRRATQFLPIEGYSAAQIGQFAALAAALGPSEEIRHSRREAGVTCMRTAASTFHCQPDTLLIKPGPAQPPRRRSIVRRRAKAIYAVASRTTTLTRIESAAD
jgi:P-type E1-E2 ATPase